MRGEIGLFPITYTVKHPPPTVTASSLALENKIDSLENAISKMKAPTSTSAPPQSKKTISSMSSMSSISSKNIHSTVNQSLENPLLGNKVEEWTSDQVSTWLISVGFDKQLADNFKGIYTTELALMSAVLNWRCLFCPSCLRSGNHWRHSIGIDSGFSERIGCYYIRQTIQNPQCHQCSSAGNQKAKGRCTESS